MKTHEIDGKMKSKMGFNFFLNKNYCRIYIIIEINFGGLLNAIFLIVYNKPIVEMIIQIELTQMFSNIHQRKML